MPVRRIQTHGDVTNLNKEIKQGKKVYKTIQVYPNTPLARENPTIVVVTDYKTITSELNKKVISELVHLGYRIKPLGIQVSVPVIDRTTEVTEVRISSWDNSRGTLLRGRSGSTDFWLNDLIIIDVNKKW